MKRARLLVSPELIQDALHVPSSITIAGGYWDYDRRELVLYLWGENLPDEPDGSCAPIITPILHAERDESGRVVRVWWDGYDNCRY